MTNFIWKWATCVIIDPSYYDCRPLYIRNLQPINLRPKKLFRRLCKGMAVRPSSHSRLPLPSTPAWDEISPDVAVLNIFNMTILWITKKIDIFWTSRWGIGCTKYGDARTGPWLYIWLTWPTMLLTCDASRDLCLLVERVWVCLRERSPQLQYSLCQFLRPLLPVILLFEYVMGLLMVTSSFVSALQDGRQNEDFLVRRRG